MQPFYSGVFTIIHPTSFPDPLLHHSCIQYIPPFGSTNGNMDEHRRIDLLLVVHENLDEHHGIGLGGSCLLVQPRDVSHLYTVHSRRCCSFITELTVLGNTFSASTIIDMACSQKLRCCISFVLPTTERNAPTDRPLQGQRRQHPLVQKRVVLPVGKPLQSQFPNREHECGTKGPLL